MKVFDKFKESIIILMSFSKLQIELDVIYDFIN